MFCLYVCFNYIQTTLCFHGGLLVNSFLFCASVTDVLASSKRGFQIHCSMLHMYSQVSKIELFICIDADMQLTIGLHSRKHVVTLSRCFFAALAFISILTEGMCAGLGFILFLLCSEQNSARKVQGCKDTTLHRTSGDAGRCCDYQYSTSIQPLETLVTRRDVVITRRTSFCNCHVEVVI